MNVWIVIPTYNEAANLESMVSTLLDTLDWSAAEAPENVYAAGAPAGSADNGHSDQTGGSARATPRLNSSSISILIVDDSSPDGTGRLAERLSAEREGLVQVLHRARKMGLGTAYLAGFSLALDRGAEVVVEMDADFSHSPNYLSQMVALLDRYDVVVGSRWAPGGRLDERWERWRYLLSKYANVYARWVTGLQVYDTTAGFKAWKGDALRRLPLHRVRSDGYAFQIEMAVASQRYGLRAAELPIYFTERERGKSKMSWRIILEAAWRVWQIRSRW